MKSVSKKDSTVKNFFTDFKIKMHKWLKKWYNNLKNYQKIRISINKIKI